MADGYSRSPFLIKGALVSLTDEFVVPIPSLILFQYNPETITRTLTPWQPPAEESEESAVDPTAQPFDPEESFDLTLFLDATDELEEEASHPVAVISGIAAKLASLEKLLYPQEGSLLGSLLSAIIPSSGDPVPRAAVPVLLFVWGPGRILPVRLTSFQVEEQQYSPTLYPTRATVTVGLRVLTPSAFQRPGHQLSASEEIAVAAYKFTMTQKDVLRAAASVESAVNFLL